MYYHVLVEANTGTSAKPDYQVVTAYDISDLTEIIDNIASPYARKENFAIDGYQIQPEKVKRLLIKCSEQKIGVLRDAAQAKLSRNVIYSYSRNDIMNNDEYTKDITNSVMRPVKVSANETQSSRSKPVDVDRSKVFIVHGHDDLAKAEVARMVEKLGLEAIILHEKPSSGMTIIEKIEAYSSVGFGIVLYTPDDLGAVASDKSNLQGRARQNVVFEHGYLLGKLKRKNVTALVKGNIEKPNDISGVVFVPMDPHGAWKLDIAKEMQAAGYSIDMNKL
jgi:predicted nucleotide-binding protein